MASQVALVVKYLPTNAGDAGDTGSIPGLGRSLGEGNGSTVQYFFLGNLIIHLTLLHIMLHKHQPYIWTLLGSKVFLPYLA